MDEKWAKSATLAWTVKELNKTAHSTNKNDVIFVYLKRLSVQEELKIWKWKKMEGRRKSRN